MLPQNLALLCPFNICMVRLIRSTWYKFEKKRYIFPDLLVVLFHRTLVIIHDGVDIWLEVWRWIIWNKLCMKLIILFEIYICIIRSIWQAPDEYKIHTTKNRSKILQDRLKTKLKPVFSCMLATWERLISSAPDRMVLKLLVLSGRLPRSWQSISVANGMISPDSSWALLKLLAFTVTKATNSLYSPCIHDSAKHSPAWTGAKSKVISCLATCFAEWILGAAFC